MYRGRFAVIWIFCCIIEIRTIPIPTNEAPRKTAETMLGSEKLIKGTS
jgi:hypothetical protein